MKRLIILILGLLTTVICSAQQPQSFSADFVQTKTSQLLTEPQLSKGHITYRSPDYLRWEYKEPQPLVWESGSSNQNRQIQNLVNLILQSVNGELLSNNELFEVTIIASTDHSQTYKLIPIKRDVARLFKQITIELNTRTQIANRVILEEKNSDTTDIIFSNIKINTNK